MRLGLASYSIAYVALVIFVYLALQEYFEGDKSGLYAIAAILLLAFGISAIYLFLDMSTLGDMMLFASADLIFIAVVISLIDIKYGVVIGLIGFFLAHVAGLYIGYQYKEIALIVGSIAGLLSISFFMVDAMALIAISGVVTIVTYPVGLLQVALK